VLIRFVSSFFEQVVAEMQPFARVAAVFALCADPAVSIKVRNQRVRAASLLATEAHRLESAELTVLAQVATRAEYDPDSLKQVKSMIADMLVKKMDDHAQDVSHKEFCDKEMSSSKNKVDDLKHKLEKSNADMDMLKAEIADDKDKISDIHEGLVKNRKSMAEAAKMQVEQNEKEGQSTPGQSFEEQLAEKSKLAGEQMALKRQQNQLEVDTKRMEADVKNKERDIIRKTKELSDMGSDVRTTQDELSASSEYAGTIQKQCVVRTDSHEETQHRRQEQIDTLKEAHDILSGDAIP